MARILAEEQGANLILVARRQERLEALKAVLEASANVQVATCVADLSQLADVDRAIEFATADRDLYGAVLNAGVTYFGAYDALAWESFQQMLNTNVTGVVRMATALIPHLEQNDGGLMLVASMAGIFPVPYQTAYAATKAFLVHFGIGLWHELEGRRVSVTTYAPGGIVTEMTAGDDFQPLRKWLMPLDEAAREGVHALRTRKYVYIPGWANRIGSVFARLLPRRSMTGIVAAQYRRALNSQRARG